MTLMREKECLMCGRRDFGALFIGAFCSLSCQSIYRLRKRLGLRVRKGI